jgi:hypothetical protein
MTAIRAAIAYGKIVPPLSPVARGGFVGLAWSLGLLLHLRLVVSLSLVLVGLLGWFPL